MEFLHEFVNWANGLLWGNVLIYLLIGAGLYFTARTGLAQLRLLPQGFRQMMGGRAHQSARDISPFQAFATGLASRVGTGNIAGVAIAIAVGGPGAVFWMWMTALLGMASAFAESTLAQLFKVSHGDNTFRGGPAYYIQQGLGQRWLGVAFALCLILAFGLVFNAVQANSIAAATEGAWGWDKTAVGVALVILSAPIIFGGVRSVARVAEWMVPVMALMYIALTVYIVAVHLTDLPGVIALIVRSAFGLEQAAGGAAGYAVSQAMMLGIKRGLFSNEAGMGSAPNAAATATTRHPATQGVLQMFGVFVDTIVICTCTAAIILLSDVHGTGLSGVQLTQKAIESQVGGWGGEFLAVAMFLFAYSSIIGNYAYAEGNVEFIKKHPTVLLVFRLMVLGMVFFGSVGSLPLVWDMADLSMGLMALINLAAIVLLSKYVFIVQKDFERQLKAGVKEPVFDVKAYPELLAKLKPGAWK
ncbi:AGCS family alanine or glycine:cation symporter [Crenobacter luteus]|uniref:Sodium:alanine symporter n=1 Tax=Crenobacter luteus TaxID=1452487 RepID=A0A163D4R8_9NEIS|nr:sodium:alanine symporter family protein [Crenobacter luteus]KZE33856.1 sodium:alanine symporter [Crenobacter luteus]TCP13863.1 AGCS family alanine or glycine:cation symporter [Crenobacter luteus]